MEAQQGKAATTHLELCLLKPSLESPSRQEGLDGQQEKADAREQREREKKEQRQKTEQLIR